MRFTDSPLTGAKVVEIEAREDARGLFARTWCQQEFVAQGLSGDMVQSSISRNLHRGTVRGMHLQLPPSREAKLVRCTRGSIYDVIVDLRPGSKTFLWHFGIELTERNHTALYIPPLMAHGFQTLEDDSEILYQMSDFYAPQLAFGLRWDDAALGIRWPIGEGITILPRDADYPDFDSRAFLDRVAALGVGSGERRP